MMSMSIIEKTKSFVKPYYEQKNIMHDFSHIKRVLAIAQKLSSSYQTDNELIELGAYFHGVIHKDEKKVIEFLVQEGISEERIQQIVQVAWDSQKNNTSEIIEGKILHDAHLLEGGKSYLVVKTLITGTAKGQGLVESLDYLEQEVLGKFSCLLPESEKQYGEKEQYAREFLEDIRKHL